MLRTGSNRSEGGDITGGIVDPVVPTMIDVKITDIDPYDRNLRIARNSKYDEIKASIRARGLDQSFSVTRRPGDSRYTVARGGNTRLQILSELYEETGGAEYLWQQLLFQPWDGERTALVGHLVENDLRADFSFFERSRGVALIREELEDESDSKPSLADLASYLSSQGYSVDRSTLSRMLYAATQLAPRIPTAMSQGLGQPQVREIRSIEKGAARVLSHAGCTNGQRQQELVFAALELSDSARWDKEIFVDAVVDLVAGESKFQKHQVRLALRGALTDDQLDELFNNSAREEQCDGTSASGAEPPSSEKAPISIVDDVDASAEDVRIAHLNHAVALAQSVELGYLIQPLDGLGFGYVVSDVPMLDQLERLRHVDGDAALRVKAAWFHLLSLSGQLAAMDDVDISRAVVDALPEDSMLRAALHMQSMDGIAEVTESLMSPSLWSFNLLGSLSDVEWTYVKNLEGSFRSVLAEFPSKRRAWGLTER